MITRVYRGDRSPEDKERIAAFDSELSALCEKYRVEISHEDGHGAFLLTLFDSSECRDGREHYSWFPP